MMMMMMILLSCTQCDMYILPCCCSRCRNCIFISLYFV